MAGFAEVRFKGTRKGYFAYETLDLAPGTSVIVEADRGEDLGEITALGSIAERKCSSSGGCATPLPELRIVRVAHEAESAQVAELRADEIRVRADTRKLVERHKLNMKVTEAEWQFDREAESEGARFDAFADELESRQGDRSALRERVA